METFEYQGYTFVRSPEGEWISKNWAMKGPITGCTYDMVMKGEWVETLEKAYQADLEKRRITAKAKINAFEKELKSQPKNNPSSVPNTKEEQQIEKLKKDGKKIKNTTMVGSFNPFAS